MSFVGVAVLVGMAMIVSWLVRVLVRGSLFLLVDMTMIVLWGVRIVILLVLWCVGRHDDESVMIGYVCIHVCSFSVPLSSMEASLKGLANSSPFLLQLP